MKYKRDIKKIVKEKNRIEKIIENMGTNPWEIGKYFSAHSKEACVCLQRAIEQLHQAELALRKGDW